MIRRLASRILVIGLLPASILGAAPSSRAEGIPDDDQCALCHAALDDTLLDVNAFFSTDVHGREGLSCADCHGGDPRQEEMDAAMSEEAGFRGSPGPLETPRFCARCHSDPEIMRRFNPSLPVDQMELYQTSVHGQRNSEGDDRTATCTSCHGFHGIRTASEAKSSTHPRNIAETCGACHADEERMKPYGIPTDQLASYRESVHWRAIQEGGDLSAPTCNDCHGNHGALPPEVESISGVCGHCHVQNRDFFNRSPKKEIFEAMGVPECEACHGNHAVVHLEDEAVGLDEGDLCAECHEAEGPSAAEISAMGSSLRELAQALDTSYERLQAAVQKGMYMDQAEFRWRDARQEMYQARTAIHLFDSSELRKRTDAGLAIAKEVDDRALEGLAEYRFRRNGLLVSTLIITLLAILLYLKIRSLDRK